MGYTSAGEPAALRSSPKLNPNLSGNILAVYHYFSWNNGCYDELAKPKYCSVNREKLPAGGPAQTPISAIILAVKPEK